MAQKINPISIRTGTKLPWSLNIQNYGKSLILPKLFSYNFLLSDFIKCLIKNILITDLYIIIKPNKINLDIFYFYDKNKKCSQWLRLASSILKAWFFYFFRIRFYLKSEFYFSSFLACSYFNSLVQKKFPLKKIVSLIVTLLKSKVNSKKLIFSKFGIKKVQLKGFKLSLVGRFENSKSQMANTYEYVFGTLPLLTLNNHIEFSSLKVFTKLGVCNIKIWLFFN